MGEPKIQLQRLLATHYEHPNLEKAHKFFIDFGLIEAQRSDDKIYYRGFGQDPYIYVAEKGVGGRAAFLGGIWVVASPADLETASKLPNASPVQSSSAPGGGDYVKLIDPTGISMTLVHGVQSRPQPEQDAEKPEEQVVNSWDLKPRKGRFLRPSKGPSKVHKLGHYGIMVERSKWEQTVQWYENLFNLTTSDIVYEPNSGKDFMCFVHIDLGADYTDHHVSTISLRRHGLRIDLGLRVCSSTLLLGRWSRGKPIIPVSRSTISTRSSWVANTSKVKAGPIAGVSGDINWAARSSTTGESIADPFVSQAGLCQADAARFDASGFIVEHYSDGDLVNNQTKPTRQKLAPDTMASWGPKITRAMMTKRIEDVVVA